MPLQESAPLNYLQIQWPEKCMCTIYMVKMGISKGLSTREAGRGHATPHMPVETAKCWWLLKIEPNAWAGGKGNCAVCVDLRAVGTLEVIELSQRFWAHF